MDPGAKVYVVWVRPLTASASAANLGVLDIGRNLEGIISAVTPLSEFELFVTAEPWDEVMVPSGRRVLGGRFGTSQPHYGRLEPQ